MRHILFAFFFLSLLLLCNSCKRSSTSTHPILHTADSILWTNPDSALLLLEQMPAPKKLKGADRALYALLLTQARYKCCMLLQNDSLIQIAVDYYEGSGRNEQLGKSYFYLGCVHAEKEELTEAIGLYLKSLNVMARREESAFVAMIYCHLGICYNVQGFREIAREMHKKCYYVSVKEDSVRACYALNDIGDTFLTDIQLDSALLCYQQSLKIALLIQDSELLSIIYSDIAKVYKEQCKYVEAKDYISKALVHSSGTEDSILACSAKGDILNCLNQRDSAVFYWNIGASSSNIYVKSSSYDCLKREYQRRKDWENATLYADSFFIYYDSIQTINDRAELDKLMDNHLVELHKQELSTRNQQIP